MRVPAEVEQGDTLVPCLSFSVDVVVRFFAFVCVCVCVCVLAISLFKTVPSTELEWVDRVPKHRKAAMCLLEVSFLQA